MFGRKSQDKGTLPPQPAAGGGLAIDVEDVNPETPETPGHRRTGSGGWLSPGKSGKKRPKRTLTTPRKGEVKQNLYEPPNLEKALERMRRLQPHEETDDPEKPTKKLSLWMKEEEMQGKFGEGIVFWFKLLRDHLLMFFIFTILSFWAFNQMRVSNEEANPSYERLGALGRVTLRRHHDLVRGYPAQGRDCLQHRQGRHLRHHRARRAHDVRASLRHRLSPHEEGAGQGGGRRRDHLPRRLLRRHRVRIALGRHRGERIRAHFEKFGEVHEVVLGKDLLEVMNLRKRLIALEANHEMLEWMLKRANKLLGIVEMDTSTMTQEEIVVARWKKLTRRVKKEIDKREGRVDVFFAALEKARDDSLSIEDRAAAAADAASKNPRFAGGKDNAGAAASKDPSNYNPAVIKQKIEQSLKDREELEDEIAACVEEDTRLSPRGSRSKRRTAASSASRRCAPPRSASAKSRRRSSWAWRRRTGSRGSTTFARSRARTSWRFPPLHPVRHPLGEPPLLHGHFLEARDALQRHHVGIPHHQRVCHRRRQDHVRHPSPGHPGVR